jgi:hypothetical protein
VSVATFIVLTRNQRISISVRITTYCVLDTPVIRAYTPVIRAMSIVSVLRSRHVRYVIQHTPVIRDVIGIRRNNIHYEITESDKCSTLSWLREEVRYHFLGRTIFHTEFAIVYSIGHKIVTNINMPSALAAGGLAILF